MRFGGARILIESLIEQGVDTIFGIPGGSVLYIYDELYRYRNKIRHILVSHEQHAAHAADAYSRSSGKVGVCIATSGPGATNLITGIAAAYMDSVPLVAITGNVPTGILGKDSFQEVDIAGVSMPVVKHNWIVKNVDELAEVVREAFIVARLGRPGPVLIDIPKDITVLSAEWQPRKRHNISGACDTLSARARRLAERAARPSFTEADIDRAASLILQAKRPLLYAGGGVIMADASEELKSLSLRLNAPVALSLMGIGAIPSGYPLCTGLIGMHGTVASNKAAQKADLLLALGARFSDRVIGNSDSFAKTARVLHFDIDPAEINKNIITDDWVIGNVKETLSKLLEKLPPKMETEWSGEIEKWKAHIPQTHVKNVNIKKDALSPRFIIEESSSKLGDDVIAVTDVGQHQIWAAQFFPACRPRSFLSSGGLGAMGFGLGAAIGAKLANPGRRVVLFTGDGSFRMNSAEMATLAAYRIPVLVIIFNNRSLGMLRQWQSLFYEDRYYATSLPTQPDFVKLGLAYGIPSYRAEDKGAFAGALEDAFANLEKGSSALIEAVIEQDEKVLPMAPPGRPIDEQIL
jgi:acetolactate synthase-1/2/3 large subunit